MRVVAVAVCLALSMPIGAVAGPILESAERIAAGMLPSVATGGQPVGCAAATAAGQEAADRNEGSTGYLVGGMFIPIIMPLIGMASNPSPSAGLTRSQDDDDLACFQDGYRERGRSKKIRSGWIGSAIGMGLYVALAVAAAAAADDFYYR